MLKQQKIKNLIDEILALKEQEGKLNAEAREWAEKRDTLNAQFKTMRTETMKLRNQRDELNEKVRELKQQRNTTKQQVKEKIENLKKTKQEIKALNKKKSSRNPQLLQKELESVEWKIQTSSLSLQEERELVERVKQLEAQLVPYKKLERYEMKFAELQVEIKALETKCRDYHEELTKTAQTSQEIHAKMLEKIENSEKIKMEADSLHDAFLQVKEKIRPVHEKIVELSDQVEKLKDEIRKEEEIERKRYEDILRQNIEKQAREKLKRGEKLSWNEFQLLAEKGNVAQD